MKFPVFDLHCDTVLGMIGTERQPGPGLRSNKLHIDLERASTLPGYCQCFACFTTPQMRQWYRKSPVDMFEKELAMIMNQVEANADLMRIAYSAAEVKQNYEKGLMSGLLTLEGTAGFGYDPALLEDLYNVGFRIVSLSWNEKNDLTGSHMTGGGLTDLGREFVKEAQRVGMIVDVSHISDEGFWDIMKITDAPIIATHSNSRAVCNNSRNLTDDMFRAIVETGGIAGFNHCSEFVTEEKPTMDNVCDHIFHFMELDPSGRSIALGGDLDGCDFLTGGFEGIQSYPDMAAKLLERGLDADTVHHIFWDNALGVMEKCGT